MDSEYGILIIGSGEASKFLAWTLAREGKRVALIERKYIGGSCPNIACLPSKNIIHSAKIASYFNRAAEFGITTGGYSVDMPAVRERKRRMVEGLVDVHLANFKNSGAELILGEARFVAPKTLEITLLDGGSRTVRGHHIIIGVGTKATIPDVPGLRDAAPLTHLEALELDRIPQHLIVLGGGYVGLELAQAMRRFGSRVTIVERGPRLLNREDPDISEAVGQLFQDEDIRVMLNAAPARVEGTSGQNVKMYVTQQGEETIVEGSDILVAAGRTPNTAGIGLDIAGVQLTDKGYIKVNERLQTTGLGIWAVGECAGSPQFTHISYDDFRVVHDNLRGGNRTTSGRQVPYCLFIDPEFARIGLNETEAKAARIPYRLAKIPMAADLRTRTLSETRGFMKALIDAKSDQILGFTVFGTGGGEIMGAVQIAMLGGLPYTALRDAILTHPTLVEGLTALFFAEPKPVD